MLDEELDSHGDVMATRSRADGARFSSDSTTSSGAAAAERVSPALGPDVSASSAASMSAIAELLESPDSAFNSASGVVGGLDRMSEDPTACATTGCSCCDGLQVDELRQHG